MQPTVKDTFQRDFDRHANRLTLYRAPTTTAKKPIENALSFKIESKIEAVSAEDLAKIDVAKQIFRRVASHTLQPAGIVLRTFPRIAQYGICFGDFFETVLRPRLLASIRMVLQCQLAKCVLDRLGVGVARHTKDCVIIFVGHR
jgi:hypothetical protein